MVKHSSRWVALGTLGVMALSSFGALAPAAHAGSKGRRNVMYGAAAVTAYGLLTHRRSVAAVGAIGTGIAYHNYRAAKSRENRQRDAYLWRRSHRYGYGYGYGRSRASRSRYHYSRYRTR